MPTLLMLFACLTPQSTDEGKDEGTGDDTAADDSGNPVIEDATVYEVNDGTVPVGATVTIPGVVVTSPVTREGEGFFVADPAGGEGSGLYVWGPGELESMTVLVGDEMTVSGTISDYYGWLELELTNAEVTGEATPPAPADLGDGAGVDWNAYESMVVTLTDQDIVAIDEFNTATLSSGVALDDGFFYLDHCVDHYDTVTGVVFYSYETWSINPRTTDDLPGYEAGTTGPATVAEVQAGVCGDVVLTDVVVTAQAFVDEGDSTFFVQDAGGGSGVAIFVPETTVDVSVGDVITLEGEPSEYYGFTEVFVADPTTIVAGSAAEPVATVLDAAPADWEPYEGMLVTLTDVTAVGAAEYGQIATDWSIFVDDVYGVDNGASDGDVFASVTGVVYYSFEEWKLEPRTAADVVR
jgi:predicted extracellular nuclease